MEKKRGCLISGGGSWGAYGGGTLARINENYDTVIGVSTGSLLAPLTALNEWELLESAYTGVNNKDIFSKCWYKGPPLTKNGKIRKFPIIMALLLGKKSVYSSKKLRITIDKFFSESHYMTLKELRKEVRVGTQNFAQIPSQIHYFSSFDETYPDFKDWMWCSSNFPFFTSLIKKSWRDSDGNFHIGQWSDGGISDLIGINQLIGEGYDDIDIILHRTKFHNKFGGNKVKNLVENIVTGVNAMMYDIEFECLYEKIKKLNDGGTTVRVFWLPRKLTPNSMNFDEKLMKEWWKEGYETAFDSNRVEIFKPTIKTF